jgi:hypothetical protein
MRGLPIDYDQLARDAAVLDSTLPAAVRRRAESDAAQWRADQAEAGGTPTRALITREELLNHERGENNTTRARARDRGCGTIHL